EVLFVAAVGRKHRPLAHAERAVLEPVRNDGHAARIRPLRRRRDELEPLGVAVEKRLGRARASFLVVALVIGVVVLVVLFGRRGSIFLAAGVVLETELVFVFLLRQAERRGRSDLSRQHVVGDAVAPRLFGDALARACRARTETQ